MTGEDRECMLSYMKILHNRGLQNGCNVALIKNTNKINISKAEIVEMLAEEYASRIFYYAFAPNKMLEVYAPFLSIMEQLIDVQAMNPHNLVKAAGVYKLHETIYESYFATGRCGRIEEPFFSEVSFEKEMVPKEIARMLAYLCGDQDIYIVLNRINYASASTLELLDYILGNPECHHVRILAFENESGKTRNFEEEYHRRFEEHCEAKNCLFEWGADSDEVENAIENSFIFNVDEMETYLRHSYNMYSLFAYDEARYFATSIYEKVQIEKVSISKTQEIRLYTQLITLSVMQGDCANALLVLENMRRLSLELTDWNVEYGYNYLMALANMHNGNIKSAAESAKICVAIAKDQNNEFHTFRAEMLYLMSLMSGFHNILISFKDVPVNELLLEQCEKYGYWNHLAHIYVYCFENDMSKYEDVRYIEEAMPHFKKGIAIGEELGNDQFLSEAYRKSIMLASYSGNRTVVTYFYEKDIMIARRSGNYFEEAMVYNGLGYNFCASEDYSQANRYFNMALEIFNQLGMGDYIIETFYNMSINAIMAEEYDNASLYLEKVLMLLNMHRKNSLRVCNISKIMGLAALASFYQGRIYNTKSYLVKDGQFLDHVADEDDLEDENNLWDDDLFLYFLCKGLMADYSGELETALVMYERAEKYMNRSNGGKFLSYPQYCIAKMNTLYKMGRMKEREELSVHYEKFCRENYYTRHLQSLQRLIMDPERVEVFRNNTLTCSIIDEVCEAERVRYVEREAKARKKEIQFFTLFQNLLGKNEGNLNTRLDTVLSAFKRNYNLDGMLLIYMNGRTKQVLYQDGAKRLSDKTMDSVVRFFEEKRSGFAISKFSGNYKDYRKIFELLFGSQIFSMIGVPIFNNEKLSAIFVTYTKTRENWNSSTDRYVLNEYDLEIYTYLARQVMDAINKWETDDEIDRMTHLLRQQAVTDELTGLHNRQGYYSTMRAIVANKEERDKNYAFVYIDLDHFKHYNDSFGHHVGDAILVKFADIFRENAPRNSMVIRLGGDEFAVLMPYSDKQEVIDMAEAILAEVERQAGFEDVVGLYAMQEVHLEKEHYAGCSIGIDFLEGGVTCAEDFEILRKNADKALYYVKEHGRNNYQIYDSSIE